MRAAVLIVTIALSGCAATADAPALPLVPVAIGNAERAAIEAGVRATLKDGGSAQFGTMAAARDSKGAVHVCGTVNGKNSYGGYTGFQTYTGPLVALGDATRQNFVFAPAVFGSDAVADRIIRDRCRDFGIPL